MMLIVLCSIGLNAQIKGIDMENVVPIKIQIISIVVSISFLIYVSRLIIKGKLDEEYAIVWVAINFFLSLSFEGS